MDPKLYPLELTELVPDRPLEVWLGVKHCLHTVLTNCLSWAQRGNWALAKLQNPTQAEELIAAQQVFLAEEGIEPATFDPDSERVAAAQDGFLTSSSALPDGEVDLAGVAAAAAAAAALADVAALSPNSLDDFEPEAAAVEEASAKAPVAEKAKPSSSSLPPKKG